LDTLAIILQSLNSEKNWLDIVSDLSVPILSLTALIITTIISLKQLYIMKYEYKLKLYPDLYELYKHLDELLIELQRISEIVGDKHKNSILKIENRVFLYNEDINDKYKEFISWINSFDTTQHDFDNQQYTIQFKNKLSTLIGIMKKYLLKFDINII
jgi:hypothetical protein